jgi:hypothetical protein
MRLIVLAALVCAASLAGARDARALRPSGVLLSIHKAAALGKANLLADAKRADARMQLAIAGADPDTDLLVTFPPCTSEPVRSGVLVADLDAVLRGERTPADAVPVVPEPAWQACIVERSAPTATFVVPRGGTRRIKVAVDFRRPGLHQVKLVAAVHVLPDGALARLANPKRPSRDELLALVAVARLATRDPISAFYEVSGAGRLASFRLTSADELARQHTLPLDLEAGHESEPYRDMATPLDLESYLTGRRVLPPTLRHDPEHADLRRAPRREATDGSSELAPAAARTANVAPGTPFLLKGKWSIKWMDTLLHPAWGWNIVAWWNDGGNWIELGNTIVSADGSYAMVVWHPEYSGQHLRMQIRARNPYFSIVKQNQSEHRYVSVDRYGIPQTFDDGARWVDAAANGADGIGEVYEAGYQLWHEMYFRAGINPMRAERVRVFFPNTWYDCDVGEIYSCAQRDGQVWIKWEHTDPDTMQHELGHQMHYEFWDDKLPAATPGKHSFTKCYDRGKALTEGYADFVPIWVRNDRGNPPQGFIESPHALFCKEPGKNNEGWVAATFWDLHDSAQDGADVIYFTGEGAVHAIFFNHGIAQDGASFGMDDFRTIYRGYANPEHQAIVDAIFAQNGTD